MATPTDISILQDRIATLQSQLEEATEELQRLNASYSDRDNRMTAPREFPSLFDNIEEMHNAALPLTLEEYRRYSRQLIVPEVGVQGQLRLRSSSVLLVGAGGLGCPAAAYLAGAGVGNIGIADGDCVELSNLHRQILHTGQSIGTSKAESAKAYVQSYVQTTLYRPIS